MSRTSRKTAAALSYDKSGSGDAPRVVAQGYGLVADMIVKRAKEAGLYVHESPEMVNLLMQVDLDSKIPPRLYQAVAELLAWLHQVETASSEQRAAAARAAAEAAARPLSPPTSGSWRTSGWRAGSPTAPPSPPQSPFQPPPRPKTSSSD